MIPSKDLTSVEIDEIQNACLVLDKAWVKLNRNNLKTIPFRVTIEGSSKCKMLIVINEKWENQSETPTNVQDKIGNDIGDSNSQSRDCGRI